MANRAAAAQTNSSQAGSSLCLTDLVLTHHAVLYRYAYRLTGSSADAEDLTQQTFLVAQQKLHQVREQNKAKAWLFQVLRSCYLKSLRKNTPQTACGLDLDIEAVAQQSDNQPHHHLTTQGEIEENDLHLAVSALPPDYRLVISMFYFEELSYKQIAETLDIPLGTVMSRLSRAKRHLRRSLSPEEPTKTNECLNERGSRSEGAIFPVT